MFKSLRVPERWFHFAMWCTAGCGCTTAAGRAETRRKVFFHCCPKCGAGTALAT